MSSSILRPFSPMQVDLTMKAEMVSDIRNYDPDQPRSPTTWAWDSTQQQVSSNQRDSSP